MFSVVVCKPATASAVETGVVRPQVANGARTSGLRRIWPASVLFVTLGLIGCAHTDTNTASTGTIPGAATAQKVHFAKVRAIRRNGDARADVTATIKPAPLPSIPLPDEALLRRQPAPDCEMRTQPAGVSPADVKLATYDYERQCYRQVEGVVRGRLDALQDAVSETIKAVKARQGSPQARAQTPAN